MLFKVLDEVCQHESHGLCHAQQAFVTRRDIIRNTTMLCRNFWAAHEEAAEGDDPSLLLALDCSKGYNRMDHSWLQRCLRAASTPPEMLAIVESLLINMPVLMDGVEFAPLHCFVSRVPCFLFVDVVRCVIARRVDKCKMHPYLMVAALILFTKAQGAVGDRKRTVSFFIGVRWLEKPAHVCPARPVSGVMAVHR